MLHPIGIQWGAGGRLLLITPRRVPCAGAFAGGVVVVAVARQRQQWHRNAASLFCHSVLEQVRGACVRRSSRTGHVHTVGGSRDGIHGVAVVPGPDFVGRRGKCQRLHGHAGKLLGTHAGAEQEGRLPNRGNGPGPTVARGSARPAVPGGARRRPSRVLVLVPVPVPEPPVPATASHAR